jgi:hypothetical protein
MPDVSYSQNALALRCSSETMPTVPSALMSCGTSIHYGRFLTLR